MSSLNFQIALKLSAKRGFWKFLFACLSRLVRLKLEFSDSSSFSERSNSSVIIVKPRKNFLWIWNCFSHSSTVSRATNKKTQRGISHSHLARFLFARCYDWYFRLCGRRAESVSLISRQREKFDTFSRMLRSRQAVTWCARLDSEWNSILFLCMSWKNSFPFSRHTWWCVIYVRIAGGEELCHRTIIRSIKWFPASHWESWRCRGETSMGYVTR